MPTIEWNKAVWDRDYAWPKDGDEWDDNARFCNVPYDKWKDSLARTFLIPNLHNNSTILEIGPGHGRWTTLIPSRISKGTLHLVDLSASCIEFCKTRFTDHKNISYWINDGQSLPFIADNSIDFVWSFDTFVHIEETEVKQYTKEFFRVLKRQAMGVIHHVGNPTIEQRQNGARSKVDRLQFQNYCRDAGLHIVRQIDSWGDNCNLKLAGDTITVFIKP